MARQRGGFQPQFRTRRGTDWGFCVDMLNQSISSSTKQLGTTSIVVDEQQTIVRIRGVLELHLGSAAAAGDGYLGAAGIALVNSDAFAQGINSIPGPQSDAHWDAWMWHSFFSLHSITATIADGANAAGVHQRIEIDTKAMRKWDPSETLVLMVEGTEVGTSVLIMHADSRMLLKQG